MDEKKSLNHTKWECKYPSHLITTIHQSIPRACTRPQEGRKEECAYPDPYLDLPAPPKSTCFARVSYSLSSGGMSGVQFACHSERMWQRGAAKDWDGQTLAHCQ